MAGCSRRPRRIDGSRCTWTEERGGGGVTWPLSSQSPCFMSGCWRRPRLMDKSRCTWDGGTLWGSRGPWPLSNQSPCFMLGCSRMPRLVDRSQCSWTSGPFLRSRDPCLTNHLVPFQGVQEGLVWWTDHGVPGTAGLCGSRDWFRSHWRGRPHR